jgi:PKD repeat protein
MFPNVKKYLLTSLLLFRSFIGFSQLPVAALSAPSTACLNQNILLSNNSTNSTSYEWDFCSNDSETLIVNEDLATITGISAGYGYKLIESDGSWYGFAVSQANNSIFRLNFGNSPLNTPSITNLGNPILAGSSPATGSLTDPIGIEIYNYLGNWYGFVGLFNQNAGIVRLDFGSSITNSPTASNLGMFGLSGRFWGAKVVEESANLILVIINRNTNSIVRVNYGNSFNNTPDNATDVYVSPIAGANLTPGFDLIKVNNDWIALATSFFTNSIFQVKFPNSILNAAVIEGEYLIGVNRPLQVKILKEGVHYVAAVASVTSADEDAQLKLIDYKDLNSTPSEITHTGLATMRAIDMIRYKGKTVAQGVGLTAKLKNLVFQSTCGSSVDFSQEIQPDLKYTASGLKNIELTAFNSTGSKSAAATSLTISPLHSPTVSFTTDGVVCKNSPINFSVASNDLASAFWSFGDASTSTQTNPSHSFSNSGIYDVSVEVTASNNCVNTFSSEIKLYVPPISSFVSPSGLVCTNNEFTFTNTTIDNFDGNLTYQWYVDNNATATTRDLKYTFASGGSNDIKLKAAIPGCFNESTQTINGIQTGPVVDFSISGKCETEVVSFTNNSSGTSHSWNFGNGNTSSQTSPTQTFSAKGNYLVSLQTNGANGCISTLSKNLTIYSKPQPNFSLNLPPFSCAGSLSQFTNSTPTLTDSNISNWSWNFGDAANGTSSVRDPGYMYSAAGDYTVSLLAKTNFGCETTLQKSVTVSPSPVASFTNAAACLNQGTKFTDGSGVSIKSWLWTIDASTYSFNNPTHVFSASGPHSVSLAVTGNNNCISTISKTVTVPLPVSINFSSQNLCEDQATTFQDTTPTSLDAPGTWSWDVGGLATKTGASTSYAFSESGTYPVKLTSTRQSGCIYSISKNVAITATPIAKFSPSPEWGTPPLSVQFLNESTGATTFQWKFNDKNNSTSAVLSPVFQFNEIGEYVIDLTATSAQGCSNTFSNKVSVVIPSLDVDLRELTLIKDETSGAYQMMVTIKNLSNYPLDKINVLVFISGNATIRETINARIIPNGEVTRLLSNQILPGASTTYLCAELDVVNDRDELNNKKCEPLDAKPVVFSPYPNPSAGSFQFDWIAAEKEDAYFEISNSMGQTVLQQSVTATQKGLNQIQVDLRSLSAGTFYFKFISGSVSRTLPISIVR